MNAQDDSVIIVISSQVAGSRVGGSASTFVLERLGHRALHLPTTLLGRHPGWGVPGGGPVAATTLFSMWEAVCEQGLHRRVKAVLSGYMADADHIAFTESVMDHVEQSSPDARLIVDPIMGDAPGGLYIAKDLAKAMADRLVPRADLLTPNLWEFEYLFGETGGDMEAMASAARQASPSEMLISSVRQNRTIGALAVTDEAGYYAGHSEHDYVPNGTGDVLAAAYEATRLSGNSPRQSLARAIGAIKGLTDTASALQSDELPLVRTQDVWTNPKPVSPKKI